MHDEVPFYLYADARGEILMASNGIKEVIEPFPFGTAILLRLAWYPELLEAAKTVVNALSYRGILMIEFVRDQRDGNWKVIEVNPRHWLFNGFYAQQGLSYTATLAKDIRGEVSSSLIVPDASVLGKVHVDLVAWAHRVWRKNIRSELTSIWILYLLCRDRLVTRIVFRLIMHRAKWCWNP